MDDLAKLLAHGVVGTYTHFEATEIFMNRGKGAPAENVLTILVAEDRDGEQEKSPSYLGERINVKGLDNWHFGIKRYTKRIANLIGELTTLQNSGLWEASGEPLKFGALQRVPPQFVPPDSTTLVPWNRVLKSNFWNGSHVFEWSDRGKQTFANLFHEPPLLQELAGKVMKSVPIDLAGLSDRLGNLVVQFPVTALISKFEPLRTGQCKISLAWHPKVTARLLRAVCNFDFDGIVSGFASIAVEKAETHIATASGRGLHRGFLWDEENEVLLAVHGPTGFIESVSFSLRTADIEPRTLSYSGPNGETRNYQVPLSSGGAATIVGNPDGDDTGGRTRKRLYREQEELLRGRKEFIQYKPVDKHEAEMRTQALSDLRHLINMHGQLGAWLWDPYLNAFDVLETLFWSGHWGADLRALTAAKEPPACTEAHENTGTSTSKQNFVARQRDVLNRVQSNWRGFKLEFRVRRGQAGWGFHDRFLILPQQEGAALAWSLGTSVNSLGTEHHIFQKVDDGQLIMNAFGELWSKLSEPEHLIWKKP